MSGPRFRAAHSDWQRLQEAVTHQTEQEHSLQGFSYVTQARRGGVEGT
jgi:hypothetical protein